MIVMILENVSPGLRGELTRWLIEPKSGVYIGEVSARVRDLLWEKCIAKSGSGGVIQLWSTNNEQKFTMRMSGNTDRKIVESEGLQLIRVPAKLPETLSIKRNYRKH